MPKQKAPNRLSFKKNSQALKNFHQFKKFYSSAEIIQTLFLFLPLSHFPKLGLKVIC